MTPPDAPLDRLGPLPLDADGPVFAAPWEAQAFALVVRLHEQGCFGWDEWAGALGATIAAETAKGGGRSYYELWLETLERMVETRAIVAADELEGRRLAWERAAAATPHGEPVKLERAALATGRADGV